MCFQPGVGEEKHVLKQVNLPLKKGGWKTSFLLGPVTFQGRNC